MRDSGQPSLARFGAITIGFFVVWYILYELILLPDGKLDLWLSKNIVAVSSGLLNVFAPAFTLGRVVGLVGTPGIEIVDGCNGIAAMGLFLGFLMGYPGDWKAKGAYALIGILALYLVNVLRIITLAFTQHQFPSLLDFTHTYSTTAIFYIVIFGLWVGWANYGAKWEPA